MFLSFVKQTSIAVQQCCIKINCCNRLVSLNLQTGCMNYGIVFLIGIPVLGAGYLQGRYTIRIYKMKSLIFNSLIVISLILISCSSHTDHMENFVRVLKWDTQLKIYNYTDRTIHLMLVERDIAASINWGPHFGEPKVLKNGSIFIKYSEIFNGLDEPVKAGDEVIFYYWNDTNKSKPKIFSKVVKL
jgi:hypothetical protein